MRSYQQRINVCSALTYSGAINTEDTGDRGRIVYAVVRRNNQDKFSDEIVDLSEFEVMDLMEWLCQNML